jgi:hypothetical protein
MELPSPQKFACTDLKTLLRSAGLCVRTPHPKTERKNAFDSIANFFFLLLNIRYDREQVRCWQRPPMKGATW